tara:strand:- start:502 stop:672 length:171 start_codon:yes stop_codon:yes gene_type:complete
MIKNAKQLLNQDHLGRAVLIITNLPFMPNKKQSNIVVILKIEISRYSFGDGAKQAK